MLLLASYDIVFQEVPGETSLALNFSACPNACPGCHSAHLQESVGEVFTDELLESLLARYGDSVTCVAFMGGDGDPAEVNRMAAWVKQAGRVGASGVTGVTGVTGVAGVAGVAGVTGASGGKGEALKTTWYSGRSELAPEADLRNWDYIKLGPYVEELGALGSPTTNQRFYRVEDGKMIDKTALFRKK